MSNDQVLQQLKDDRTKVVGRIKQLNGERQRLDQEIARREGVAKHIVAIERTTRKNESQQYYCGLIGSILQHDHGDGLETRSIYDRVHVLHPALKYSTFRSYLHWMQNAQVIFKSPASKTWRIYQDWKQRLSRFGGQDGSSA